jgi:signal transduction histidine kinase
MPRVASRRFPRLRLGLLRPTARLRLTLLYGGLFLVSGAALLTATYVLFQRATHVDPSNRPSQPTGAAKGLTHLPALGGISTSQARRGASPAVLQHASDIHELLTTCLIAFAVVGILAIALGWLVAGRVLRPLRTMNTMANRISASNLHERLTLNGPDDEFKELGETLNSLLGRLEASFKSQEHFVTNASHELRTPLTLERSLLESALANRGATVESWEATGQRLLATNRQQAQLIDALLTLACSQRGLETQERLDLAAIAEDVIDARDYLVARRGLYIETALNPAPMVGDPDLMESLVANLIDNALRHNIAGGRVDVATGVRAGAAAISVGNTGLIIPEDETTRLLQPFQRLTNGRTGTAEGHGVGLAIVQAIVTAHGANLTLRPKDTGGLDVEVSFPVSTAARNGRVPIQIHPGAEGPDRNPGV